MKLSAQEKAAQKAAFRAMSPAKKLDHIWTYWKWPILLALLASVVLGSVLFRRLTRKEPTLYLALANVAAGAQLEDALTADYLPAADENAENQAVYLYRDLYLSANADEVHHAYAYASRMKVMGAIQAQKLDAVIMNREAYDLFSSSGYLLDLSAQLTEADPTLLELLAPCITQNVVVLSDNAIEWQLNEADAHEVVTETVRNGVELTDLPLFRAAGFDEPLYFGVIANSPRAGEAARYLRYLAEEAS